MNAVFKYPIYHGSPTTVMLPAGAKVVQVGDQFGTIHLWVEVDMERPTVDARQFAIVATGQPIDRGMVHRGTIFQQGGGLVWHVYEITGS